MIYGKTARGRVVALLSQPATGPEIGPGNSVQSLAECVTRQNVWRNRSWKSGIHPHVRLAKERAIFNRVPVSPAHAADVPRRSERAALTQPWPVNSELARVKGC